jgi:outer membrane protein OmpA-like peptidoglycan-associated protein
MPQLKKPVKLAFALIIAGVVFGVVKFALARGLIPGVTIGRAHVISTNVDLMSMQDATTGAVPLVPLPGSSFAEIPGSALRLEVWAWNAQIGCLYAIGGSRTTEHSLFAQHRVPATATRQDDTNQMMADLLLYARAYAAGDHNPTQGANAILIMGSQAGGALQGLNTSLASVGDSGVVAYVCGRSDGEDAVMGPAEWKSNPRAMLGRYVSVVPYEGDADLLKAFAKANNLPFNPDPTTYDAGAINIIAANDYVDAADKFVAGYTESRHVVRNGVRTGATVTATVDGVSTWTPADVKVAMGRGGLVRIVSTHELTGIMPNVVIVLKRWATDNRATMVNAIKAWGEAGDQVLSQPSALRRACEISAQIYREFDADYWCTYYRGVTQPDKTGHQVQLGGSRAANLADNVRWFGLRPGMANIAGTTYTTFASMLVELYPQTFTTFPPVERAFDTSFLEEAIRTSTLTASEAEGRTYSEVAAGARVAERSWHIRFATGQATITPAADRDLSEMLNQLVLSDQTVVQINGHTDNVGNPTVNQSLSQRRAQAVKTWLEAHAAANFRGRLFDHGYGDTQPVADNRTESGRAQNRRVDIVQRARN